MPASLSSCTVCTTSDVAKSLRILKDNQVLKEVEFCATEKKAYLDSMRINHPVEFRNIINSA